jgi:hypothetical protein
MKKLKECACYNTYSLIIKKHFQFISNIIPKIAKNNQISFDYETCVNLQELIWSNYGVHISSE